MGLVCAYKIMKSPEIDTTVRDYYYYVLREGKGKKEKNKKMKWKYNSCLDVG